MKGERERESEIDIYSLFILNLDKKNRKLYKIPRHLIYTYLRLVLPPGLPDLHDPGVVPEGPLHPPPLLHEAELEGVHVLASLVGRQVAKQRLNDLAKARNAGNG